MSAPGGNTSPTSGKEENTTAAPATAAGAKPENIDETNPPDFSGEVDTNNGLPSLETLRAVENHPVWDNAGKTHPFKSLYSGHNVARRMLIIFIRHFFCGNCQEYLRTLSASITPHELLGLPVSTFIAVIGCGTHELINNYVQQTKCPFPVYADPTQHLYSALGMRKTLALGSRPAYLQNKTVAHTVLSGVFQGLKQIPKGLVMKMGDQRQVGGEFLFEPASRTLETPILSPVALRDGKGEEHVEEKCVTWCHRMRTTRDHAEIPELMEVLGLEGTGVPAHNERLWQQALATRKGTGLSMAGQMSRMSAEMSNSPQSDPQV
ncbi:AhpC/TSA antioxidant enzyme-domain-containing protein [Nemania sp. FL0031]|nr:AhpC/TSA antioxidant enzyme-domain-containing protein [Nemania sp. FL0031]